MTNCLKLHAPIHYIGRLNHLEASIVKSVVKHVHRFVIHKSNLFFQSLPKFHKAHGLGHYQNSGTPLAPTLGSLISVMPQSWGFTYHTMVPATHFHPQCCLQFGYGSTFHHISCTPSMGPFMKVNNCEDMENLFEWGLNSGGSLEFRMIILCNQFIGYHVLSFAHTLARGQIILIIILTSFTIIICNLLEHRQSILSYPIICAFYPSLNEQGWTKAIS